MWDAFKGRLQPQPHHHNESNSGLNHIPFIPKCTPSHMNMNYGMRVHPNAHLIYTIWMWDPIRSLLWPQLWHNNITPALGSTPKTPKFTTDLQRRITVRVAPYAYKQHIKVPKHFVYIQYGCGIQSEACCSLNNYITTLHGLRSTPKTPKSTRDLQRGVSL